MDLVMSLKSEMSEMKEDYMKVINLRFYHLERNVNLNMQYNRRESFEIVGIPTSVENDKLEDEVIDILKDAKVSVNRQHIKKMDICAVHRLHDKKTTIVRVVNRKWSKEAVINGKNLKGTKRYGEGNNIYVNHSFCPEFKFLNYVIRKASRDKEIFHYKFRNGVPYVQKDEGSNYVQIGHI